VLNDRPGRDTATDSFNSSRRAPLRSDVSGLLVVLSMLIFVQGKKRRAGGPIFNEEVSVNGSWFLVPALLQAGKKVESSKSKENA
jgi:hypothetical protein